MLAGPEFGHRLGIGLVALGWGLTLFTTEAGLTPDGAAGTFTPQKLVPLAILVLGAALTMASRPVREPRLTGAALRLFIAFLAWQAVCVLASDFPTQAALRVAQAVLPLAVVVVLLRRRISPMPLVITTLVACAAHVFYALRNPTFVGYTGEQRLIGLLIANSFALVAGMTVVISLGLWQGQLLRRSWKWLPLPLIAAAAYAIYLSVGRTTSIAVPLAVFIGATVFGGTPNSGGRFNGRRALVVLGFLGALYVAASNFTTFESWFRTGNRSISTLTGRTDLWEGITQAVLASPLFGYGPGAMRFGSPSLYEYLGSLLSLGQAHNSLMEAFLNSGFVGASLWLAAMVALFMEAAKLRTQTRPLAVTVIIALAVYSLTLGNMAGFGVGWYVLMLAVALASDGARIEGETPGPGALPTDYGRVTRAAETVQSRHASMG